MEKSGGADGNGTRFEAILQSEVPKGRDGKHKQIILELLEGIEGLSDGCALKIRLDELPDTKENIRSALNRATRQRKLDVFTCSDAKHLYIWKASTTEEQQRSSGDAGQA